MLPGIEGELCAHGRNRSLLALCASFGGGARPQARSAEDGRVGAALFPLDRTPGARPPRTPSGGAITSVANKRPISLPVGPTAPALPLAGPSTQAWATSAHDDGDPDWSQDPFVQFALGSAGGMALGYVPIAGPVVSGLADADVLGLSTREARIGKALGQMVGGLFLTISGISGKVIGTGLTMTGIGAVVGLPAIVVSAGLMTSGMASMGMGAWELSQALMSKGSGSGGTVGGPRAGQPFTRAGKRDVIEMNRQPDGTVKCENCGVETVPAQKSARGVKPPSTEVQVDHIQPKVKGATGHPTMDNLCAGIVTGRRATSGRGPRGVLHAQKNLLCP